MSPGSERKCVRRSIANVFVAGLLLSSGAQLARAGPYYNINDTPSTSDVNSQYTIGGTATMQSTDVSSGSGSASISNGDVSATTTLSSTNLSMTITKSDSRDGDSSFGDYSQSQWVIFFTPTQTLDYSITGTYTYDTVADAESLATYNAFLTQGATTLYSGHITTSSTNPLSLTTNVSITDGALTGVLQAGVQYDYNGTCNIVAPPIPVISGLSIINGDNGDTATGSDTITFTAVPEPTSFSLLILSGAGLLMRRRRDDAAK